MRITLITATLVNFVLPQINKLQVNGQTLQFRLDTPDKKEGVYLSTFGIFYKKSFSFKVKACNDAHVFLKTTNSYFNIQVVLGGWKNTKSVIRFLDTTGTVQVDDYPALILSCETFKTFWIDWNSWHISVGHDVDKTKKILDWTSTYALEIVDIGVLTAWGSTGIWELDITSGIWGKWFSNGGCSVTCGRGIQKMKRNCEDPLTSSLPTYCVGNSDEFRECQNEGCHGGWSNWEKIEDCSTTCGSGTQLFGRMCNNPVPGDNGSYCHGDSFEYRPCLLDGCPGNWGPWQVYEACSVSCGNGTRFKARTCDNPPPTDGGRYCIGEESAKEWCNLKDCPVTKWTHLKDLNLTKIEMKEVMKEELAEIKANLTVNSKNTTSAIRRRTSARDERQSAASVGYIGALLLAIPVLLLVCLDCSSLFQKLKTLIDSLSKPE